MKNRKRWIIHRLAEITRLCDNTSIGWNYLCIFDVKYKFRTILLQIIWALVSTATLNPFELEWFTLKRHPRRSDEEWLNIIKECRTSGLPDKTWCLDHGIQPSKFYYHIRRLKAKACEITERDKDPHLSAQRQEIVQLSFWGVSGKLHSESNIGTNGSCCSNKFSRHIAWNIQPCRTEPLPQWSYSAWQKWSKQITWMFTSICTCCSCICRTTKMSPQA